MDFPKISTPKFESLPLQTVFCTGHRKVVTYKHSYLQSRSRGSVERMTYFFFFNTSDPLLVQGLLALALASPLSSWEQWELRFAESQPDFEHSRGKSESPSPTGCDFNSMQAVCAVTESLGP